VEEPVSGRQMGGSFISQCIHAPRSLFTGRVVVASPGTLCMRTQSSPAVFVFERARRAERKGYKTGSADALAQVFGLFFSSL